MAIKGLVGKEGNTLGTPEQPWDVIYANNFGGAFLKPDFDNRIVLTNKVTKNPSFSSSASYFVFEPFPENGFCYVYMEASVRCYIGIIYEVQDDLVLTSDLNSRRLNFTSGTGSLYWHGLVRKGSSIVTSLATSSVSQLTRNVVFYYPFKKE